MAKRGPAPAVSTRVLLVLDQPVMAELVKLTLSHGRYDVRHVVDAGDAVQQISRWWPQLVILDMDLEGVAGARVMDHLRPDGGDGHATATIALTLRGDLRTKLEAFERGVDDIL